MSAEAPFGGPSSDLTFSGETPDPSISDAVCAIIYAAPRTELKELHQLREILMHKVGNLGCV